LSEPTYELLDEGRTIRCLRCNLTSHNPNDVEQRYCGHCTLFHESGADVLLDHNTPLAPAPPFGTSWPAQHAGIMKRLRAKNPDHPWVKEEQLRQAEAAALRAACSHALRALDLTHDEDRLREHLTAALASDAGAVLLAERTALRARVTTLESIIQGAGEQLGQGDIPLAVAIARLHVAHADAWKLIGRCDMALELVEVARSIRGARARASEMRAEIKKASGG
jgi:hypothetical protein